MAKTATQWRYFLRYVQDLPLTEITADWMTAIQRMPVRRLAVPGRWFLVTSGTVMLLFWNGRLVVATGVGVAVMALIYVMQDWRWQVPPTLVKQVLQTLGQPLVLAVGGGSAAMLTTYWAASVWAASDNAWIATGGIVQAVATLSVLLILSVQALHRRADKERSQVDHYVLDLTHPDALRRLIAVRQLTRALPQLAVQDPRRREWADYFRLMLGQESEPMIRDAVMDGLQALEVGQALPPSTQSVVPRPTLRPVRAKVKQRAMTDF